MYLEPRKNRLLLSNGVSLVSHEEYARLILKGGSIPPSVKVERSFDSNVFQTIYGVDISFDEEPQLTKQEYPNIDLYELVIENSERFERIRSVVDEYGDVALHRINDEIEFFQKNNSYLIKKLVELVTKFKEDGVVWGCGRGSSCASLLLYVIEIHDINPLKYQIPFSELSKESESEY